MRALLIISFVLALTLSFGAAGDNYINKGNELYRKGDYANAEVQYRQAVQENPSNETAKYNLANALEKQKKHQEAQALYDELTHSKDPRMKSAAFYNTGVAFSAQKDLESSIDAYKNALRTDPDDREARENLQKALSELKKQQNNQSSSNKSNMSGGAADQKLKELEQKEKQVQQKMQNQKKGEGGTVGKDW